jgi:hypothetical protein
MRKIWLIIGDRLSGKTSLCKSLYTRFIDLSLKPYAIVEENERDDRGIPIRLILHELTTGQKTMLGTRMASTQEDYGPFSFAEGAFGEAAQGLTTALRDGFSPIILDEVGPLEVLGHGGFWNWLSWAIGQENCFLVISIRPGLESAFIELVNSVSLAASGIDIKKFYLGTRTQKKILADLSKEML